MSSTAKRLTLSPDDAGAVAVEFAFLIPVLIMLSLGIIEFGRGYNASIELTGAVREGARALALGRSSADAEQAVIDASPGLNPEPIITGSTTCPNSSGRGDITASVDIAYNIPFVSSGTWTITRTGVMRCGG